MIPVFLSIQGLYSYQEEQTIDFQKLMSAQLFGIFGAVGSGKSSILEAITFAVFGESERLNKAEKRSYNMMNLRSDTLKIVFDFEVSNPAKRYRCEVYGKRKKNNFQQVDISRSQYLFVDNEFVPTTEAEMIESVGLTYQHFKRTIIIPQGKFQDFVHLSSTDRTKMLQDIFQLEKFDLAAKTASLNKKNDLEKESTQGELKAYEQYSEEEIELISKKIIESEEIIAPLEKEITVLTNKIEVYKRNSEKFNTLTLIKSNFSDLMIKIDEIQSKKNLLTEYSLFKSIFQDDILKLKYIKTQFDQSQNQNHIYTKDFQLLKDQLTKLNLSKSEIEPEILKLDLLKQEIVDLKILLQIQQKETVRKELETKVQSAKKWLEEKKQELSEKEKSLEFLKSNISDLKKETARKEEFYQIKEWFTKLQFLESQLASEEAKNQKINSDLELSKTKILTSFKVTEIIELQLFVENSKKSIDVRKQELSEKEKSLTLKNEIARFANQLQDGKACPICGSEEHPDPISTTHANEELKLVIESLKALENDFQNLNRQEKLVQQFLLQQSHFEKQINELQQEITSKKDEIQLHKKGYSWTKFTSKIEFNTAFETLKAIEIKLLEKENQKLELENSIQKDRGLLEKGNVKFTDILQENIKIKSELETLTKQLKILLLTEDSSEEIEQQIKQKEVYLLKIQSDFLNIEQDIQSKNKNIDALAGKIEENQSKISQYSQEIEILEQLLNHKYENNATSKSKVEKILSFDVDEQKLRSEITDFDEKRIKYQTEINSIEFELQDFQINNEYLQESQFILNQKKTQFLEVSEALVTLKSRKLDFEKSLRKKNELLTTLENLTSRELSLKTMKDLFRGAGFVNFVSGIYLKQLCAIANTRFRKLSNQQLELEIGDDNNFYIKDFLHGGQLRHVKTLSGGQTFQISLSLALALAESIQQQQKNEQNFFFLDEGFGTLDKDALQLVFETLKMLRKENRFVGIISHVEDLQHEMPFALKIVNDLKKGSLINSIEL